MSFGFVKDLSWHAMCEAEWVKPLLRILELQQRRFLILSLIRDQHVPVRKKGKALCLIEHFPVQSLNMFDQPILIENKDAVIQR